MELFTSLNVGDAECRRWLAEVIRAPADYGQPENRQHHEELKRRHARVEARLPTLPDPPVSGEITREEWAARRAELQDPKSALRVQLEASDRDGHDVAERSANGRD
jgi:hypothetical protein